MVKRVLFILLCLYSLSVRAQNDSIVLTIEQLYRLGIENNLRLRADYLNEQKASEQAKTARMERLPDIEVGLRTGFVGQPVFFERGLSSPTYPDMPDWSQNYSVNFTQPLYQGGRIRHTIHRADLQQ